jgi:chromosome segregation ATPase
MSFRSLLCASLLAAPLMVVPVGAQAQNKDGEQRRAEQVRRLQEQNQRLQAEATKAKTDLTKAEADKKTVEDQVKASGERASRASREAGGLKAKIAQLEKQLSTLETENKTNKDLLAAQLSAATAQSTQQAALIEMQRKQMAGLQADLQKSREAATGFQSQGNLLSTQLQTCSGHNRKLVSLVDETAEQYRTKRCADARSMVEPLMGLRRAEFDRIAEGYKDRASDERFVPDQRPKP